MVHVGDCAQAEALAQLLQLLHDDQLCTESKTCSGLKGAGLVCWIWLAELCSCGYFNLSIIKFYKNITFFAFLLSEFYWRRVILIGLAQKQVIFAVRLAWKWFFKTALQILNVQLWQCVQLQCWTIAATGFFADPSDDDERVISREGLLVFSLKTTVAVRNDLLGAILHWGDDAVWLKPLNERDGTGRLLKHPFFSSLSAHIMKYLGGHQYVHFVDHSCTHSPSLAWLAKRLKMSLLIC